MLAILSLSLGEFAIGLVVVLGVIALVMIAAKALNVPIPAWVWQVLGVVFVVVVVIVAIRFVMML